MTCPYCNAEMKQGSLVTAKDLSFYWLPKGKRFPLLLTSIHKIGGEILGYTNGLIRSELAFYRCETCDIGISPLSEKG
ncbi:PF20097 family protein [Bengtsoniella intestinalis]|uniref:PF20097 family protein n=1 Tax=Bengtsoniella intestinalis TaxID=3073143 RepID=UPI00391F3798